MSNDYNPTKCLARKASNPEHQCKNRPFGEHQFCRIHLKSANVQRIDQPLASLTKTSKKTVAAVIIPVQSVDRMRITQYSVASLRASLDSYRLPSTGIKAEVFTRLVTYFSNLAPYLGHQAEVERIQRWFRRRLWKEISSLQGPALYQRDKCLNDDDILSLDSVKSIPTKYFFSFQDHDSFVYGFDIRTLLEIIKRDGENPYNRHKLDVSVVKKTGRMEHLLKLLGIKTEIEQEEVTDPHLLMKQRAVKVFDAMDSLDQYTNPNWFLNLSRRRLILFYKETEDIWNYRLNLSASTKEKIYPPSGKIFTIPVSTVQTKINQLELQNICLDFMEKLVFSAEARDDRVNGCIYALLGLVIVSQAAAEALPSYYSMVSVHSNSNEVVPI